MNKDIDFNSKKFLILLLIVCIVFFIIIVKAFEYLPSDENELRPVVVNDINRPITVNTQDAKQEEQEEQEEQTEQSNKKTLDIKLPKPSDAPELEEIDAPNGVGIETNAQSDTTSEKKAVQLTPEETARNILGNALRYRNNGQFEKALNEYKKIPTIVLDKELVAESYEGIATVYAMSRRYGTALSFAVKAYNLSPSSSREILLARLYYKTGDIEKATKRINNVLHRDFANDK